MAEEKKLLEYLKEWGYTFSDPIYSLVIFFMQPFAIYTNHTAGNV